MRKRNLRRPFRKPRPRRSSSSLDFRLLEPRQLLAGDAAGFHQALFELPTGINLVSNGDFESFTPGEDHFYTESEVVGWKSQEAGDLPLLNLIPSSGNGSVLDLDSTAAHFDRVYQDIATEAGRQYLISFDFCAHPSDNPNPTERTYDFEVWWNHSLVATYTGGQQWQTGSVLVTAGSDATTELLFCEAFEGLNGGGDSMGPLLDNIRVLEAVEQSVVNGSFETMDSTRSQFFRPFQVPGWGAMGNDLTTRLIKIEDLTTGAASGASAGDYYLNLDTTKTHRDIVFQDLQTEAGATYYVTFDLRVDGPQENQTDQLRVRWGDAWATTIQASSDWQTYGIMVGADSDLTRLTFLEPGNGNTGDGSGPLIDSVRLFRVDPMGLGYSIVDQLDGQTADFGKAVTFDVNANFAVYPDLSFAISSDDIPTGNNQPSISETGLISWTPSQSGPVDLKVTVTDPHGLTDEMSFTVTVDDFVPYEGTRALTGIPPELRNGIYSAVGAPPIKIDTSLNFEARFTTTEGVFSVNLDAAKSPQTVNNFVLLARDGFYDGIEFHRVLEGFMGQSGDPTGTGRGGPGYTFGDETSNGLTFDQTGLIAMANTGQPGSNGSQFFITFGEPTYLDGKHTIFGKLDSNNAAFLSTVITHTVEFNGAQTVEVPIPGIEKTVIESVTIHVT